MADRLLTDKIANWSKEGALTLATYLDLHRYDEFNIETIRNEFTEYPSTFDAAMAYGYEDWEGETVEGEGAEQEAARDLQGLEFLEERMLVLKIKDKPAVIIADK